MLGQSCIRVAFSGSDFISREFGKTDVGQASTAIADPRHVLSPKSREKCFSFYFFWGIKEENVKKEGKRKKEGRESNSLMFAKCRISSYVMLRALISERLKHFLGMVEL